MRELSPDYIAATHLPPCRHPSAATSIATSIAAAATEVKQKIAR